MGSFRSVAWSGRVNAADRRAKQDYSRGVSPHPGRRPAFSRLCFLLILAGLAGGVLLIAADLSTLYEVDVLTVVKASIKGHSQHSYAVALIGVAALPMTLLAARSRPAMLALGVLGVLALAISAIAGDFHDIHSSGLVGRLYERATAAPKRGFYFETLGGVLLILAGFGRLLLTRRPSGGASPRAAAAGEPLPRADPMAPPERREPEPPLPPSAEDETWF